MSDTKRTLRFVSFCLLASLIAVCWGFGWMTALVALTLSVLGAAAGALFVLVLDMEGGR